MVDAFVDPLASFGDDPLDLPDTQPIADGSFSLSEALWRLADDRRKARRFANLFWRSRIRGQHPDQLTFREGEYLVQLEAELEAELLEKLRTGAVRAYHFPASSARREWFDPQWWVGASISVVAGSARRHGGVLQEVRIVPGDLSTGRADRASKSIPMLRAATPAEIAEEIRRVYAAAAQVKMKPPNVKQLGATVSERLAGLGLRASQQAVQEVSDSDPDLKNLRGPVGKRVNAAFQPFSAAEI